MRILLDTNVFVSGVLGKNSPPALLIELWLAGGFTLVTSQIQFDELERVLARPKIARRISPEQSERLLEDLRNEASWADNLPVVDVSPDPDDNLILATAIAGKADLVVSGDRPDMQALGEIDGTPILSPRQTVERLLGESA